MESTGNFALVTGASSGIGWKISEELVQRGYNLIAVSNQQRELEELKYRLEETYSVQVITLYEDLAKEGSAQKVFTYCTKHVLKVEVLVNSAGMLIYGETIGTEYSRVESIIQLHVATPTLLCRLFGEKMVDRRKGYILNISSISALMPYPTISLYGPTKTYLRYFSRALRTELRPFGINVTCLMPGATVTSFYDAAKLKIGLLKIPGVSHKPEIVARRGVKSLFKNRAVCVPGVINRIVIVIIPLLPNFFISLIYKRILRRQDNI